MNKHMALFLLIVFNAIIGSWTALQKGAQSYENVAETVGA